MIYPFLLSNTLTFVLFVSTPDYLEGSQENGGGYGDHKALESIYNSKPLKDICDEISDIVVSTYRYNFTVEYVKGKDN